MKTTKLLTALLLVLLLTVSAVMTACTPDGTPVETTDGGQGNVTDPATDTPTEAPTEEATEPDTEADTTPPAELTADELKTLLAAALELNETNAAVTLKAYMGEELYNNGTIVEMGDSFLYDSDVMGYHERLTVLGDKAYYYVSMSDGVNETVYRYALTLTAEERAELYALYVGEESSTGLDDAEVVAGILNSTMTGKRYADGHVELTCTGLDASLITLLMGEPMEGATLSFDFTLDAEGRMTLMCFTIVLPAELTGGEAVTVRSEAAVDYAPDAITAPADAADYASATYDELFGFQLPELDPAEAASVGLPVDGDHYIIGGENPAHDPAMQYTILYLYAPYYADKTFTVYGNVMEDDQGNLFVELGEEMGFPVYFDGVSEPAVGSYVKITATFTKTLDMGDYVDFDCFTLMASACEVLGEAKGPNGGKLMFITASALNVRSEPDSSKDNKVGMLYSGDVVEVLETGLGTDGNWCKITFDCDLGYAFVSMTYVSDTKP